MDKFQKIREVLHYIDDHLDEIADYEQVASVFYLSPYYFHRLFSAVVGKPIAAYIRERRLAKRTVARRSDQTVIHMLRMRVPARPGAFSRAFRNGYGISNRL